MKIRCVGQRIVVERLSPEQRGGIILPFGVKDRSLVGRVLHKGPDAEWVKVGDIVHFARYSGTLIKADDEHIDRIYEGCLYMNCEDILGVLDGKPAIVEANSASAEYFKCKEGCVVEDVHRVPIDCCTTKEVAAV